MACPGFSCPAPWHSWRHFAAVVPGYSDGLATDFDRFPFTGPLPNWPETRLSGFSGTVNSIPTISIPAIFPKQFSGRSPSRNILGGSL